MIVATRCPCPMNADHRAYRVRRTANSRQRKPSAEWIECREAKPCDLRGVERVATQPQQEQA